MIMSKAPGSGAASNSNSSTEIVNNLSSELFETVPSSTQNNAINGASGEGGTLPVEHDDASSQGSHSGGVRGPSLLASLSSLKDDALEPGLAATTAGLAMPTASLVATTTGLLPVGNSQSMFGSAANGAMAGTMGGASAGRLDQLATSRSPSLDGELEGFVDDADALTCNICFEKYTNPRVLHCLHVFCQKCLTNLVDEAQGTIVCPTCSQTTRLDLKAGGIMSLKLDYMADAQLVGEGNGTAGSVTSGSGRGTPAVETCGSCSAGGQVVARCFTCPSPLCQQCVTAHQQMKIFETHNVKSRAEIEAAGGSLSVGGSEGAGRELVCERHAPHKLQYFCFGCQEPCCADCIKWDHQTSEHKIEHIEDIKDQQMMEMRRHIRMVRELDWTSYSNSIRQAMDELQQNKETAIETIQEGYQSYKAQLEARRDYMLAEAKRLHEDRLNRLFELAEQLEKDTRRVNDAWRFAERMLAKGSPVEVASLKRTVMSQFVKLLTIQRTETLSNELEFKCDPALFECAIEQSFGHFSRGSYVNPPPYKPNAHTLIHGKPLLTPGELAETRHDKPILRGDGQLPTGVQQPAVSASTVPAGWGSAMGGPAMGGPAMVGAAMGGSAMAPMPVTGGRAISSQQARDDKMSFGDLVSNFPAAAGGLKPVTGAPNGLPLSGLDMNLASQLMQAGNLPAFPPLLPPGILPTSLPSAVPPLGPPGLTSNQLRGFLPPTSNPLFAASRGLTALNRPMSAVSAVSRDDDMGVFRLPPASGVPVSRGSSFGSTNLNSITPFQPGAPFGGSATITSITAGLMAPPTAESPLAEAGGGSASSKLPLAPGANMDKSSSAQLLAAASQGSPIDLSAVTELLGGASSGNKTPGVSQVSTSPNLDGLLEMAASAAPSTNTNTLLANVPNSLGSMSPAPGPTGSADLDAMGQDSQQLIEAILARAARPSADATGPVVPAKMDGTSAWSTSTADSTATATADPATGSLLAGMLSGAPSAGPVGGPFIGQWNSAELGAVTAGTGELSLDGDVDRPTRATKTTAMTIRAKFGQLGPGRGQFNSPHGFCLGLEEEIIVADTNNHRIQVFDKSGEFKMQFGVPGKEEGQLWYPRKVAVIRPAGKFVICDRGNERSRMQIFSRQGQFLRKIAIRFVDIVAGLAVTNSGCIVAVDSVSPSVFLLAENGDLQRWFDCGNYMKEPSDIAVHGHEFYVCDFRGHCVVVFSDEGRFLHRIGTENITNYPNGIDVSDAGDILVGDSHGNRFHVAVFQKDGGLVGEFECPYVKVSRCCGLKITSEGYIITLAKNNHHVLVLNTLYIQ